MSLFSTPTPPKPQIATTANSPETTETKSSLARRKGLASTIATSGLGVPGPAPIGTPSLYGV